MFFTQPAYLWLFTGLLIPVGIHLLSRKEGKVVRVGSLRHVEDSITSQFKSIRLNEILLLVVRCLMITFLVFFLSGARCTDPFFQANPKWVLLEDGLQHDDRIKNRIDLLVDEGYELRSLSDGFPLLNDRPSAATNYWHLADLLASKNTHDIIVFSYNRHSLFQGERKPLPANVRWIDVEGGESLFIAEAVDSKDSIRARLGNTAGNRTSFTTSKSKKGMAQKWLTYPGMRDSVKIRPQDTIIISMMQEGSFDFDRQVLEAAMQALQREFDLQIVVADTLQQGTDWLFWLSEKPLPKKIKSKALYYQPSTYGSLIQQESESAWRLTRRLDPTVAIRENMVPELFKLLFPSKEQWDRVAENDRRVLPQQMAWSGVVPPDVHLTLVEAADWRVYFLLLFLFSWVVERVIAIRKNQ